ncbi:MFS transporter [Pirellulaceae bacterium]|nr:MFS transporter [Pirellulaceae bacterium]
MAIAIFAQILTAPGQTVGVSEFKDQFGANLNISSRTVAIYYCYGTAIGSLGLPLFGVLIDRYGCRITLALVALLFSITCYYCGRVDSELKLLVAFTGLRMLGQGALSLVASTMISLWFRRRLALAYSVMSVGSGIGMMMLPYIFKPLFENYEMAVAFRWIAGGVIVLVPISFLFVINRPQNIGLSQDGEPLDEDSNETKNDSKRLLNASSVSSIEEKKSVIGDFTFLQAIATPTFWIVTAAQSAWALIGTGLVFNRKDIFQTLDASETITDLAVPALFGAVIISQIVTGLIARRFSHAILFTAGCTGMSAACGLLLLKTEMMAFAGFFLFGLSQGIFVIMGQSLWADFYGRSHIGKIRGLVWMVVVAASSLGGFALTLGDDQATEFRPIEISGIVMAILCIATLYIRKPLLPESK